MSINHDERPLLVTIPTELERQNGMRDVVVLGGAILLTWSVYDGWGWPWWIWCSLPFLALWALTGEAAGDVGFIGGTAAALRYRFGMRRAHEWVVAYIGWWHLAVWPHWRDACLRQLNSFLQRMIRWLRLENVTTKWSRWPRFSWASVARHNWLRRRAN